MANVVQFEDVGLRYPGSDGDTLSDVHFTLLSGGFYFLTGPSGAGKTSLLKLLYLARRPTAGTIRLFGEDAGALPRARLPGFRRRIGVVFQDFRLVPHLSAFDNIALPLRLAGVPESDVVEPVHEMLGWVGLSERSDSVPPTLSGGEQQRIAIARAVIGRPEILVADEPTGNVDPDMAARLLHLFESLNRLGTTVVVATHDFHLLGRVPNAHMMRIEGGKLFDPTGALRNPPAQPGMSERVVSKAADRRILDDRGGGKAMMWIMAIMLFLTVIAGGVGLGMVNAAGALDRQLAGRLTVQIVTADPAQREADAKRVLAALSATPDVARAAPVDRARLDRLLKPWLGDSASDADVPVPALIDVDMRAAGEDAAARIAAAVRAVTPNASADAQSRWLSPVADFMRTLIAAAGLLLLLMVVATMAAVLLAVRAGLETHRDTIAILHMLGSTDVQVARLFQRRIALDTLTGGVMGTAAAMAAAWLLGREIAGMGSDLATGGALAQRDWLILAALPLLFAGIATIAARLAVLRRLGRVQ